jgi:hypothetical protein
LLPLPYINGGFSLKDSRSAEANTEARAFAITSRSPAAIGQCIELHCPLAAGLREVMANALDSVFASADLESFKRKPPLEHMSQVALKPTDFPRAISN